MRRVPRNLKILFLELWKCGLGENNGENMKFLSEGIKRVPIKLKGLSLYLGSNNLGENVQNIRYLSEGLKKLPDSLEYLGLFLFNNGLGEKNNGENLKWLGEGLK